jgi:hypothetical protein
MGRYRLARILTEYMNTRWSHALLLLLLAALVSCGGRPDSGDESDKIQIISVTPSSAIAGRSIEFTVTFSYKLSTTQNGVVDLGFFIDGTNQVLTGQRVLIRVGSGQGTLKAFADPANYTTSSDFAVGLLLSEEPHGVNWTPLARDKIAIPVSK